MFWRALIAFLAMPGVVAIALPLAIGMREPEWADRLNGVGALPLITGAILLVRCAYDFYVSGKGTPAMYTVFMAALFHLRIVHGEEPWLARTHGKQWDEYRARVPRWLI